MVNAGKLKRRVMRFDPSGARYSNQFLFQRRLVRELHYATMDGMS